MDCVGNMPPAQRPLRGLPPLPARAARRKAQVLLASAHFPHYKVHLTNQGAAFPLNGAQPPAATTAPRTTTPAPPPVDLYDPCKLEQLLIWDNWVAVAQDPRWAQTASDAQQRVQHACVTVWGGMRAAWQQLLVWWPLWLAALRGLAAQCQRLANAAQEGRLRVPFTAAQAALMAQELQHAAGLHRLQTLAVAKAAALLATVRSYAAQLPRNANSAAPQLAGAVHRLLGLMQKLLGNQAMKQGVLLFGASGVPAACAAAPGAAPDRAAAAGAHPDGCDRSVAQRALRFSDGVYGDAPAPWLDMMGLSDDLSYDLSEIMPDAAGATEAAAMQAPAAAPAPPDTTTAAAAASVPAAARAAAAAPPHLCTPLASVAAGRLAMLTVSLQHACGSACITAVEHLHVVRGSLAAIPPAPAAATSGVLLLAVALQLLQRWVQRREVDEEAAAAHVAELQAKAEALAAQKARFRRALVASEPPRDSRELTLLQEEQQQQNDAADAAVDELPAAHARGASAGGSAPHSAEYERFVRRSGMGNVRQLWELRNAMEDAPTVTSEQMRHMTQQIRDASAGREEDDMAASEQALHDSMAAMQAREERFQLRDEARRQRLLGDAGAGADDATAAAPPASARRRAAGEEAAPRGAAAGGEGDARDGRNPFAMTDEERRRWDADDTVYNDARLRQPRRGADQQPRRSDAQEQRRGGPWAAPDDPPRRGLQAAARVERLQQAAPMQPDDSDVSHGDMRAMRERAAARSARRQQQPAAAAAAAATDQPERRATPAAEQVPAPPVPPAAEDAGVTDTELSAMRKRAEARKARRRQPSGPPERPARGGLAAGPEDAPLRAMAAGSAAAAGGAVSEVGAMDSAAAAVLEDSVSEAALQSNAVVVGAAAPEGVPKAVVLSSGAEVGPAVAPTPTAVPAEATQAAGDPAAAVEAASVAAAAAATHDMTEVVAPVEAVAARAGRRAKSPAAGRRPASPSSRDSPNPFALAAAVASEEEGAADAEEWERTVATIRVNVDTTEQRRIHRQVDPAP